VREVEDEVDVSGSELPADDFLQVSLAVGRELAARLENDDAGSDVFDDHHGNSPLYSLTMRAGESEQACRPYNGV
jgi:hypothetical protein